MPLGEYSRGIKKIPNEWDHFKHRWYPNQMGWQACHPQSWWQQWQIMVDGGYMQLYNGR